MATYRKKPVEIEAVQWTGENVPEVTSFLNGAGKFYFDDKVEMQTIHGEFAYARKGDWIAKEPMDGRFYPIAESVFANSYEPA